jgi:hypothetical protein
LGLPGGSLVPENLKPAQFYNFFVGHFGAQIKDLASSMAHTSSHEQYAAMCEDIQQQFDEMKEFVRDNVDVRMSMFLLFHSCGYRGFCCIHLTLRTCLGGSLDNGKRKKRRGEHFSLKPRLKKAKFDTVIVQVIPHNSVSFLSFYSVNIIFLFFPIPTHTFLPMSKACVRLSGVTDVRALELALQGDAQALTSSCVAAMVRVCGGNPSDDKTINAANVSSILFANVTVPEHERTYQLR